MSARVGAVTFDAADSGALARFWAAVFQAACRPAQQLPGAYVVEASGRSPTMLFLTVPEPKTAKNRCHIDVHTDNFEADLARLVALGAAVVQHHDEVGRWVVLSDVEGNEFCLVEDTH